MEFALESATNGNHSNISVQEMETGEAEEVQYIYDDTEMIMAGPHYSDITDLVLEDGTRAMIVNGTLVTADGQTLILQDGTDLSQYSFDENADEIVISKDQEDQFLQIMSTQNNHHYEDQSIIHYVQGSNADTEASNDQQVLYIQDGENILPIQGQYQIAELNSQNSNEPIQMSVEPNHILDKVEDVIDLEQLLLGQQGPDNLDTSNYQYAVLKDGKFHLQTSNGPMNILGAHEVDRKDEVILGPAKELNSDDYLDLSSIKGRNLETGQVITLSRIMDKYTNKKINCDFPNKKENIKNKLEDKSRTNVNHLKKLINKKITIGQTEKGKKLVGKIVNVMKKPDVNKDNNINPVKNIQSLNKGGLVASVEKKELSKIPVKELINLVDDDADNSPEADINLKIGNSGNLNLATSTNNSFRPHIVTKSSNQCDDRDKNTKAVMNLPKRHPSSKDVMANRKSPETDEPRQENHDILDCKILEAPEHSKVIVQKKIVSKDCFDVISRTLAGLMNMDSVVKKLRNKILIIKIIEKTFSQITKDYEKTVSYCSGYMVREYKLDDENSSFSESWRFIPDTNSKETILGQDNLTTLIQDGITNINGLKRFVNLTIQITVSSEGIRTTKVIINPPALFQCKACSKSFRTSALLKVHSLDCHTPTFACEDCPLKFRTAAELKEHTKLHTEEKERRKGMYECVECNQCFQTPGQIRKHMNLHYQPSECHVCKQKFPTVKDLSTHILTHSEPRLPQLHPITDHEQDKSDRKVFSCHICTRQFSRHSNLQRHIEIHQGEGAMYQCAVCNCSYHYISSLTRHVVSCHVDKSKKMPPNIGVQVAAQGNIMYQDQELEFLQNDQIVQMIPLDHMSEEAFLQQFVTENIEYGVQDFQETENAVQILQIPVDSNVVIDN